MTLPSLVCIFFGHDLWRQWDRPARRVYTQCQRCRFTSAGITTGPPADAMPVRVCKNLTVMRGRRKAA